MHNLTARQSDVLAAISEAITENGYPPTVREIGKALSISSVAAVHHLEALEHKGAIVREPATARGIRIVDHT